MNPSMFSLCLLFTITDTEADKKLERIFSDAHLPIYYQCRGQGTAKSEWLNICGLSGRKRLITIAILPKRMVSTIFTKLQEDVHIKRKGRGIAGTIPMTGIQEMMQKMLNEETYQKFKEDIERNEKQMNKASHTMIIVAVKEGFSDDVIDVATKAGARGGSVIRGRRRGSEAIVQFLGISMQEEQELIMIIVPKEKKTDIMKAVSSVCGLKAPAQGVIISIPVDEVIGMEEL